MGPEQVAVKKTEKSEAAPSAGVREAVEGFVLPDVGSLVGATRVAKDLKPEALKAAYQEAQSLNIADAMQVMDFGLDVQQQASAVTREFIDEVRSVDLEEIAKIARTTSQTMEELKIGDLKPGFGSRVLSAILPKRAASAVQDYLSKHQALSEMLTEQAGAMAGERIKLQEHHERMAEKIKENQGIYDNLSGKIAVAELSYEANKKRVEEMKKAYEGTTDAARARELGLLDQALARQGRRITTLMASRQETLTAMNMMDMQIQGIESQIQLIDEQVAFNRQVWDNSILISATDKRMENAVTAVQYNREQVEKMMTARGKNVGETLRTIMDEQANGVVNIAVLEVAAAQVALMNKAMADGAEKIRTNMAAYGGVVDRLDQLLRDAASDARKMSPETINELSQLVNDGGSFRGDFLKEEEKKGGAPVH